MTPGKKSDHPRACPPTGQGHEVTEVIMGKVTVRESSAVRERGRGLVTSGADNGP